MNGLRRLRVARERAFQFRMPGSTEPSQTECKEQAPSREERIPEHGVAHQSRHVPGTLNGDQASKNEPRAHGVRRAIRICRRG